MGKRHTLLKIGHGNNYVLVVYADETFYCYFVDTASGQEEVVDFAAEKNSFDAGFFVRFYLDVMVTGGQKQKVYYGGMGIENVRQEVKGWEKILLDRKQLFVKNN